MIEAFGWFVLCGELFFRAPGFWPRGLFGFWVIPRLRCASPRVSAGGEAWVVGVVIARERVSSPLTWPYGRGGETRVAS